MSYTLLHTVSTVSGGNRDQSATFASMESLEYERGLRYAELCNLRNRGQLNNEIHRISTIDITGNKPKKIGSTIRIADDN